MALFIGVLVIIPTVSFSQKKINTPFSRFNYGYLENAGSFRSLGMGGVGTGMRDNNTIYYANPASYSSIDTNSFVFDFGMDYGIGRLTDGSTDFSSQDMGFHNMTLGFPVAKRWGVAFGIVPFSDGYYGIVDIVDKNDENYDPAVGRIKRYQYGSGGLTSVFLGTGVGITKNISLGGNMNVIYGSLTKGSQVNYIDDYYSVFNHDYHESADFVGVLFDLGLQYSGINEKGYFFNAGISTSLPGKMNADYQKLACRYTAYNDFDTLSWSSIDNAKSNMPFAFKGGVSFGKKDKFVVGVDYQLAKWSKATLYNEEDYFGDAGSWRVGAEYVPNKYANYGFFNRLDYRAGVHLDKDYLSIDGRQVKAKGVSIGLGIPLRKSLSKVNIYLDYTHKKYPGDHFTHDEDRFVVGVSLALHDYWFFQQKYD